jgi:hypothetical protein
MNIPINLLPDLPNPRPQERGMGRVQSRAKQSGNFSAEMDISGGFILA